MVNLVYSLQFKSMEQFKAAWPQVNEILAKGFAGGKSVLVEFMRPRRNSLSNRKLHAMIGDIHKQAILVLEGESRPMAGYKADVCKAFMVKWFDMDLKEAGEPLSRPGYRVVDPLDGEFIYVRPSTKDMTQEEACKFIEWLYSWGCNHGVVFSDPAMKYYEEFLTNRLH
jgi:hypothetical protein